MRLNAYLHISEKRLHRYPAEFDVRYSNRVRLASTTRSARNAPCAASGKSLTYRRFGRPRSEA